MFNIINLGIIKCPGECEYRPCGCCEPTMPERCSDRCHAN